MNSSFLGLTYGDEPQDAWRILEADAMNNITSNSTTNTTTVETRDSQILRETFSSYGTAFLVVFFIFSFVRLRWPKAYNIRNWSEEYKSNLARYQYGLFSWAWKLSFLSDDEIMESCGLDALSVIRLCSMGMKLSGVSMFGALLLMPTYKSAEWSEETSSIDDGVEELTTAHIPDESPRLIATALVSYVVFGFCMYLILKEFDWFIERRHRYLRLPLCRNYSVYVRNVPEGYRNNNGLKRFFEKCMNNIVVLEANIGLGAKKLKKAVAQREKTLISLEHALAVEEKTGERPTHKLDKGLVPNPVAGILGNSDDIDSIQYYSSKLKKENESVARQIEALETRANERCVSVNDVGALRGDMDRSNHDLISFVRKGTTDVAKNTVMKTASITTGAIKMSAKTAMNTAKMVVPGEDGEIFSAGFLSFQRLRTVSAVLQMIHHEKPYSMEVAEAPDPDDVFWMNVGRGHSDLQLGRLASAAGTTVICLLWTIPVTFVSGLSSAEALSNTLPFIASLLQVFPGLAPLLEVLAPQLLVILNSLLPMILRYISAFEGPVSGSEIEASLFRKLAAFVIIQTFFVSAISGSLFKELEAMIRSPEKIVTLLATTLPQQSTFFMQMSFVQTFTSFMMEGLRIVALVKAFLRKFVGPNLTKREQKLVVMGLQPLCAPDDFEYADHLSNLVLLYMVLLVYAVISPLVGFIIGLCFLILGALFRHQFVYIYKAKPDSGGKLWIGFVSTLTWCVLIAEITIAGLLALKKGKIAAPLMFPLIAATVLFSMYIRQKHYQVAEFLPSRLALGQDEENDGSLDLSFLKHAYVQPEMCDKEIVPDVAPDKIRALGFNVPAELDDASDTSMLENGSRLTSDTPVSPFLDDAHAQLTEVRDMSCRVTRFVNLPDEKEIYANEKEDQDSMGDD